MEELPHFRSHDAHHMPIIHFILAESVGKPIVKLLQFMNEIPCLEEVSTMLCAHSLKAGKCIPGQALRILCVASQSDRYLNIVKSLLQADTNVDGVQDGMTPLMNAAIHGSLEIINILLVYKASVDYTNSRQETSLLLACRSSQWQAAKLIFDQSASALSADDNGQTPLHVAITNSGVEFVQYMAAQQPVIFNKLKEVSSLSDACQFRYDILIKMYPCSSNEQVNEVVTQACLLRNTDILQNIGQTLENHILVTHITQAYQADHFDCLNVLLRFTEGRRGLTCPDISLTESCKSNELINLTKFLVTKGKKNISENNGAPLRMASQSGNLSAVKYLIQKCHVKVDEPDTQGATALLHASKKGHLDIIDLLLKWGADVNTCADETPLTAVCKNYRQDILNRLLKESPNLCKANKYGMTAVEVAVNNGHATLAVNLMKKGATLSFDNISFHNLCQLGDLDQIKAFLQTRADHQIADHKLLCVVVKDSNSKLLDYLLDSEKVDMSIEVLEEALKTAIIIGSKTIARTLIEWKHWPIWNESHISLILKHQHADILELLLMQGWNFTLDSWPLDDIVKSKVILKLVLERNMPQSLLNEALLVACSSRHRIPEVCVRLLLDKSAEVNYRNSQTQLTPLLAATIIPSETLVKVLLEYGADPNVIDSERNSPLYLACDSNHHSIASLLVYNRNGEGECQYMRAPADPNMTCIPPEKCPLWIACLRGYLDIIELLAENKANLNIQKETVSLLEASHKAGQHEVVRLLLEYGADPVTLFTVDLKTACVNGYAERAVTVSQEATMRERRVCISKAGREGFLETGLGIIINISDECKQRELFNVLQRNNPGTQLALPDDAASRESQEPLPPGGTPNRESQTTPSPDGNSNSELQNQLPVAENMINRESHNPISPDSTSDLELQELSPDGIYLWQCYYNQDMEQMMKLIKDGYNPNIRNVHGTTLLQACLSDKRIPLVSKLCSLVDINQKDSLGRNVLFYVLKYMKGRPEQADLFHLLVDKGADMKVTDNFGRTLLHEWDPQISFKSQAASDDQHSCKRDISLDSFKIHIPLGKRKNFKTHIPLGKCDFKKQTPLHDAVLQENPLKARKLLEAGSIPTIHDNNGVSPFIHATRNPDMYKVFVSVYPSLERIEDVAITPSEKQKASFSNEYTAPHRIPAALNKLFHKANLQSSLRLFQETFEVPLLISKEISFKEEFKTFCTIIPQFMKDLSDEIKKEDPLFAFEPKLSGSCSEGTKVVAMDEADTLCLFSHPDWKEFSFSNYEKGNYTFMSLASDSFAKKYPKLVNKSCLSVHGVFGRFYGLIRKALAKVLQKYSCLYIREPHSILESTYAFLPSI